MSPSGARPGHHCKRLLRLYFNRAGALAWRLIDYFMVEHKCGPPNINGYQALHISAVWLTCIYAQKSTRINIWLSGQ